MNHSRLRFTQEARKQEDAAGASVLLGERDFANIKRLSGYCLAAAGAKAKCLNDDLAIAQTFGDLKPNYDWTQNKGKTAPDVMVGVGILQKLMSGENGGMSAVKSYLKRLYDDLPEGGRLVLRENALLSPEEMVLLELPDYRGKVGKADVAYKTILRLVDFSQRARPWLAEGYRGFYCEELPEIHPDTKLFSLPIKWATEFILRRNLTQDAYEQSLTEEYIIATERALRTQIFNQLGFRVVLHAPHWDKKEYETKNKAFQLYKDDEHRTALPPPPNELVIVAEKMGRDSKGQWIAEQRTARERSHTKLALMTMQNKKNGDDMTIVTGMDPITQILPWRYLDDGRVGVYVHNNATTPMVNTKPRTSASIDGRRFAGYIPAPLQLNTSEWESLYRKGTKNINQWLEQTAGLSIRPLTDLVEGKLTFPAPDFIDQSLQTIFVQVQDNNPHMVDNMICYDANDLLHGIHTGVAPSATLEAQLWQLAKSAQVHLNIMSEYKIDLPIDPHAAERVEEVSVDSMFVTLAQEPTDQQSFKVTRGNTGDWRLAKSTFVEESAHGPQNAVEQEFILNEEEPLHRAALFCLSRGHSGQVLAGFDMEDCPVPTRFGKPGKMLKIPTVPLPGDLNSIPELREYIANHLEVDIENVIPAGEAVFTHTGVTPQKIFPFLITRAPWFMKRKKTYTNVSKISRITELDNTWSFLWTWGSVMNALGDGTEFCIVNNWENRAAQGENRYAPEGGLSVLAHHYG